MSFLMTLAVAQPSLLAGDKQVQAQRKPDEPRIVSAVRTAEPITIDGRLEEKVWQAPPAEGFTQSDPQDGAPATERTKVWIAYDDKALYVAALCYDSEPLKIMARLGRRDDKTDSDWFFFAVDPYNDKRSGYIFGVNPAGSIIDGTLNNDINEDDTWDGVWESKALITTEGWSVEMRIPFNQMRFPAKDEYVWGINFRRIIKRKNETVHFAWVPKSEQGYVSRFARLEGLKGISPGRHVEFMPYAVGDARFQPAEAGNPFQTGHRIRGNTGFDLKMGLKSNLTLDATVNPDFGQVEVDPAVINLSAYETYYDEKRPFFIEGSSIFDGFGQGGSYLGVNVNWPQPKFFYSRRIGRAPEGEVTGDGFVDFPDRTTILGAGKVTGKLGDWNVGLIEALTAREDAAIDNLGVRSKQEVEPFSSYGVFRAEKDIKGGFQGLGVIATGVMRDLRTESLRSLLNKNAFSLGLDGWSFLDKNRDWVFGGWAGATRVEGTTDDILRLQTSSLHYYQRPDATHVRVDPNATTLAGWGARLNLAKQNGSVLVSLQAGALSPGFDPTDIGFQFVGSDVVNLTGAVANQWTKPGNVFRYVLVAGGVFANYDFGGNRVGEGALAVFQGTLRNFWQFNHTLIISPATLNNRLTRGGPLALSPSGWNGDFNLSTDSRRPVVWTGELQINDQPKDGQSWNAQLRVNFKPAANISLSIGPQYGLQNTRTQWVGAFEDPLMTSTFGTRYVFGQIDQKIVAAEIRMTWAFTPKLSLQAYIQPFIGVGKYARFKELARPRVYQYNLYGAGASTVSYAGGIYTVDPDGSGPAPPFSFENPDFNLKSLRGTIVLRWEYLPGSLAYFVWTQNRSDDTNPGIFELGHDLGRLLTAPGDNIFLFKISYHWNI